MLGTGVEVHIALIALVDPAHPLERRAADRAVQAVEPLVGKSGRLTLKGLKALMGDGLGAGVLGLGMEVRHARGENTPGLRIEAQALGHVEMRTDKRGVVRIAQRVVRNTGLLDTEVLHGTRKGFLIFVPAGLQVVDELQVHPSGDPIPVQIVNDDILLEDALVVTAPGQEGDVVPAPGAKALQRLGKAETVGQTVLVEAGDFFDFIVHTLEVDGTHVDREFLAGRHVLVQLHRTDLNDLSPQMDGELVKYGGLGAHRLIPLQIHHDIVHR